MTTAFLTALAVLAWWSPRPSAIRLRAARLSRPAVARAADGPPPAVFVAGAAVAAYLAGPVVAVVATLAALLVSRLLRARAAARALAAVRAALPELCRATSAELRTGVPPPAALAAAAADMPPGLAAHVRRLAADPTGPWDGLPGAERLPALGALWSVAADAGSGLADGLDRLAGSLAADERRRAEVAAQLAGPKATAAVLAALPLCGVALAASLGADPASFLLRTPAGAGCLTAGAALDACGILWVGRLTRAALS